ncbi:MAG: 1-acyl-sn-glycerol-3-phosphate acyltransferase [Cyanobacteria bacterium J06600_6]
MSEVKFIPPEQSTFLVRLLQSFFYLVTYFAFKFRLLITEQDLAKVRAIADSRVVYLPNHSNLDDAVAVFQLSARIGQMFHYVVAIEAFRGAVGTLMRKVGAYSIRRGVGDRPSVVQTLKILQQPASKLVVFPEGGCSYQNDTVIPFRTGAVELSFKALERIAKQSEDIPNLYLVPVSLKYCYPQADHTDVSKALAELETALAINPQGDNYSRIRAIAGQILTSLEAEYQLNVAVGADWNERLENLRTQMLNYCEAKLDLTSRVQLRDRERVYKIQSVLRNLEEENKRSAIDYEHLYLTTVRLLNFDAIYDGYIAEKPTPERYFATIDRFEREVFQIDQAKPKGRRHILTKIGTPINLKDHWQAYKTDKEETISYITQTAQQQVQANLS